MYTLVQLVAELAASCEWGVSTGWEVGLFCIECDFEPHLNNSMKRIMMAMKIWDPILKMSYGYLAIMLKL